jgi:hypothetical protein
MASSFVSVDIHLPDDQAESHDILGELIETPHGQEAQRSTSSTINVCV